VDIPSCYSHFSDVFCPKRELHNFLHTGHGTLPSRKIYPLSIPEQKAMEEYVKEAPQQGYILPSTSLSTSTFFFLAKKNRGLRQCIDYRALNKITLKLRYPLPLVSAAL